MIQYYSTSFSHDPFYQDHGRLRIGAWTVTTIKYLLFYFPTFFNASLGSHPLSVRLITAFRPFHTWPSEPANNDPLFPTTSHLKATYLEKRKDKLSLSMYRAEIHISIELPSFVGSEQTAMQEDYLCEGLCYHLYTLWQAQCYCCQVHLWWSYTSPVCSSSLHEIGLCTSIIALLTVTWVGNSVMPRCPTRH
mgnify:CR=1 FL=1